MTVQWRPSPIGLDVNRRWWVLLAGAGLALWVTWYHWSGLLLGGLVVGLAAPSTRRAMLYGLTFGVLVLVTFGLALALNGGLAAVIRTSELALLSVAMAVGLPVIMSAVRGVLPH